MLQLPGLCSDGVVFSCDRLEAAGVPVAGITPVRALLGGGRGGGGGGGRAEYDAVGDGAAAATGGGGGGGGGGVAEPAAGTDSSGSGTESD